MAKKKLSGNRVPEMEECHVDGIGRAGPQHSFDGGVQGQWASCFHEIIMSGVLYQVEDEFISFVVDGEPASKSNSSRIVFRGRRPRLIKSHKALNYEKIMAEATGKLRNNRQVPPPIVGDVLMVAKIYYASRRPDLDESLIMDTLQGFAYGNDRQIKAKIITWGLDRERPRAEITIYKLRHC